MDYQLTCKNCKITAIYSSNTLRGVFEIARTNGWAIARDNVTHYCPVCAPDFRNVGRAGSATSKQTTRDYNSELARRGFTQISFDDVQKG